MESSGSWGSPRRAEPDAAEARSPWSRFHCWLECVCVVTFDLELGQAIEVRGDVSFAWLASLCRLAAAVMAT